MAYGNDNHNFDSLIGGDAGLLPGRTLDIDAFMEQQRALGVVQIEPKTDASGQKYYVTTYEDGHTQVVKEEDTPKTFVPGGRKGVFSTYPAVTPKYSHTNDDRSLETMARLMIPLPDDAARKRFIASFHDGSDTRKLAEALATIGGEAATGQKQYGLGYIDFLLQSAQEAYEEKVQIVDVLSDNYVAYYFGSKPSIFQYTGTLLNSRQDDWRSAFTIIYNDIIRGTELARRRVVVTLSYDDMAVTGTIMNMTQTFTAEMQLAAQFTFALLVQRIDIFRTTGHTPTELASFPEFIKPGAFAVKQFEVPPKTIRVVNSPTTTTVKRKKTPSEDDDFQTLDVSSVFDSPDVRGAGPSLNQDQVDALEETMTIVSYGERE